MGEQKTTVTKEKVTKKRYYSVLDLFSNPKWMNESRIGGKIQQLHQNLNIDHTSTHLAPITQVKRRMDSKGIYRMIEMPNVGSQTLLEYIDDLKQHDFANEEPEIKRRHIADAINIIINIAEALDALYDVLDQNVQYGDLHKENVILDRKDNQDNDDSKTGFPRVGNTTLIDFELSNLNESRFCFYELKQFITIARDLMDALAYSNCIDEDNKYIVEFFLSTVFYVNSDAMAEMVENLNDPEHKMNWVRYAYQLTDGLRSLTE